MTPPSLLLAVGAWLAVGIATPVRADGVSRKEQEARRITFEYARCVVRRRPDRAADAILSNADNATISARYEDLIRGECMGSVAGGVEVSFGGDLYRYALADALVNADFVVQRETDFANRLPLAHLEAPTDAQLVTALESTKSALKRTEIQRAYEKRQGIVWLSRFGECVVRRDPVNARLWLLTRPDEPEEVSRISALRAAFADCLANGTMRFSRSVMRGTVAINYYRLAKSTVQPTGGKPQ